MKDDASTGVAYRPHDRFNHSTELFMVSHVVVQVKVLCF